MGAAARAMSNFGLSDLAIVQPYAVAWTEARSAVGAEELIKSAKSVSMTKALHGCHLVLGTTAGQRRELRQPMLSLPKLPGYIKERLPDGGRVAILFGSEKRGLANEDLERCHALLRVPTSDKTPSMNLSHAVAVTAYELARASKPSKPKAASIRPGAEPPTAEQLEDLLQKALAALARIDFMQDLPKNVQTEKLRRKFVRWRMSRSDAAFLQAFFKRVP
jgi:tRNA/rRNA methyltransferase